MAVIWNVMTCSLSDVSEVLKAISVLMMETASTSKVLVNFYLTIRRYIPEDSHLHVIFGYEWVIKQMLKLLWYSYLNNFALKYISNHYIIPSVCASCLWISYWLQKLNPAPCFKNLNSLRSMVQSTLKLPPKYSSTDTIIKVNKSF